MTAHRFVPAALALTCGLAAGATSVPAASPPPLVIAMHAESGSKLEGIATLTDAGDAKHPAVSVMILYANTMFIPEAQYPTEIRAGKCGAEKAVHAYSLNPVQEGRSATTLAGVTLAKLLSHPYAINVHAANAIERYLSCGEIVRPPPSPAPTPT
jgi:hypothetical protein